MIRGTSSPETFGADISRQIMYCWIADDLYWSRPAVAPGLQIHHTEGLPGMTYLDVVFSYGSVPGESEVRAIDSMREVYGIRAVRFDEKQKVVRVEFDASRLKQDAVVRMLRQAGIDVLGPVAQA